MARGKTKKSKKEKSEHLESVREFAVTSYIGMGQICMGQNRHVEYDGHPLITALVVGKFMFDTYMPNAFDPKIWDDPEDEEE